MQTRLARSCFFGSTRRAYNDNELQVGPRDQAHELVPSGTIFIPPVQTALTFQEQVIEISTYRRARRHLGDSCGQDVEAGLASPKAQRLVHPGVQRTSHRAVRAMRAISRGSQGHGRIRSRCSVHASSGGRPDTLDNHTRDHRTAIRHVVIPARQTMTECGPPRASRSLAT